MPAFVCVWVWGEWIHSTLKILVYLTLSDPEYSDLIQKRNWGGWFTCYTKAVPLYKRVSWWSGVRKRLVFLEI